MTRRPAGRRQVVPKGRAMDTSVADSRPRGLTATVNRYAPIVKWVSVALILLSVFLILRALPIARAREFLGDWVGGLGFWGPVVFGLIYVGAVVLLVPASALTLIAGAIFEFWVAVVVVSLAATT